MYRVIKLRKVDNQHQLNTPLHHFYWQKVISKFVASRSVTGQLLKACLIAKLHMLIVR